MATGLGTSIQLAVCRLDAQYRASCALQAKSGKEEQLEQQHAQPALDPALCILELMGLSFMQELDSTNPSHEQQKRDTIEDQ